MIYVDEAIKTRYAAAGLLTSIGKIFDHQQPEHSVLPYVSYANVSDNRSFGTQASRYQKTQSEFTIWHTGKNACEQLCELLEQAFINSNFALTNPLALTQPDGIVNCMLTTPYIVTQISDTIWSGVQTFSILYRRDRLLHPA